MSAEFYASGNRCQGYVFGLASSGKVWRFFAFIHLSERLNSSFFAVFFSPFPK